MSHEFLLIPFYEISTTQILRNIVLFYFQATGLTGLAVAKKPHHTLGVMYGKLLRAVAQMPNDAAYRKYTEQIVNERLQHVKNVRAPSFIEIGRYIIKPG